MTSAVDLTEGIDIIPASIEHARRVSSSLGLSTSPAGASWAKSGTKLSRTNTASSSKHLKPFATEDIKILLLENVNLTGRDLLESQGYQVSFSKSSLPEDELIEKIRWGNASGTFDLCEYC